MDQAALYATLQFFQEETGGDRPTAMFMDAAAMKEKVRSNLFKEPYDVSKFYHPIGLWRDIATSPKFEKITLLVIALNACWIGVDTDRNDAEILLQASPTFQLAEHAFCAFFSFEWFARFMSFKKKRSGLRDGWFVFDTLLVFMMIMETWALTAGMLLAGSAGSSGGLGNASILRMARLARLTRMARMARLLRAMPELMILIKGITTATRSVFFTLCLLLMLLYIFGIAFTQLLVDTDVGDMYFRDIGHSMYTLLVAGTLMDNIGGVLKKLCESGWVYGSLFMLFVLLATVTVLNMLIGVLCEVVSTVAAVEKETMVVNFVKTKLLAVLESLDEDGSGTISKDEFMSVLDQKAAVEALDECGVDVEGIYEFADFIFTDEDSASNADRELAFNEFIEIMLQFRGTNVATVKDIVDLTKFVKTKLVACTGDMRKLRELITSTVDRGLPGDGDSESEQERSEEDEQDEEDDAEEVTRSGSSSGAQLKERWPIEASDSEVEKLADCRAAQDRAAPLEDARELTSKILTLEAALPFGLLQDCPQPPACTWTPKWCSSMAASGGDVCSSGGLCPPLPAPALVCSGGSGTFAAAPVPPKPCFKSSLTCSPPPLMPPPRIAAPRPQLVPEPDDMPGSLFFSKGAVTERPEVTPEIESEMSSSPACGRAQMPPLPGFLHGPGGRQTPKLFR